MMRTSFVARTLFPHFGQISFRVLLGLRSPLCAVGVLLAAPLPAIPRKPVKLLRAIRISFQPFSSAYAVNLSLSLPCVFQP